MRITNSVNCPVADCPVDLGPACKLPCYRNHSNHPYIHYPHRVQVLHPSKGHLIQPDFLWDAKVHVRQIWMATPVSFELFLVHR